MTFYVCENKKMILKTVPLFAAKHYCSRYKRFVFLIFKKNKESEFLGLVSFKVFK